MSESVNEDAAADPWLARADWAAGRVNPAGGSWSVLIVIAIVWNLICLGVGYIAYPHLRAQFAAGEYLILLLLLFPLVGVGLAINAVRSSIQGRRLGRMWLELKTVPASAGQFLGGVLHSDAEMNMKDGVRLTLTCYKEKLTVGRNAKGRSVSQLQVTPEWSETQVLDRELLEHDRTRTALPVYFRLPREVPGTQKRVGPVGYYWQLEVTFDKAARANLLSAVRFDVPVFKTLASDRPFTGPADGDPVREFKSDKPLVATPEAEGLRVSVSRRGGTVFDFQAPQAVRGAGCTIALLVMSLIAGAATWHLWRLGGSGGALVAAAVCALLLLFLNYLLFQVTRLTLDVGEAEFEHTLFGIGVRRKFDPALIASVEPERDKAETREVLWDIPLVILEQKPEGLAYKKRYMLMPGLERETADTIAAQLRSAVAHAVAGNKREFRVALGADPEIDERRIRFMRRYRKTVNAVLVAAVLFIAWQVLYVDYAKKRQTVPYRHAMDALQANANAREALGEPISAGWFTDGAVNDLSDDVGWTTLAIPVAGSRAKGRLHIEANKKAGEWQYSRLELNVGSGESIQLATESTTPQ